MALYPLKFKPRLLEKMWAGRKFESMLGRALPPGKNIGESWEIYDFPPGVVDNSTGWNSAEIANGPLAGKTLHDLVVSHEEELLGGIPLVKPHGQFPILIKFLDAREDLSIQVHPDEKYAAAHPEAFLKSEAWYVVQSDPGARLFKGLKPGVTRQSFERSIYEGHCENLLNSIEVKAGQCFYLPSGTVHAIGGGILAAEVQTPSDTTFRVYDFNRVDPTTGKTRTLHVDQALDCIHFAATAEHAPPRSHVAGFHTTVTQLVRCEYFTMEKVRFKQGAHEPVPYDQPVIWIMLQGRAEVLVDNLPQPVEINAGQTLLLPASMANPQLRTLDDCVWLEVTFPA